MGYAYRKKIPTKRWALVRPSRRYIQLPNLHVINFRLDPKVQSNDVYLHPTVPYLNPKSKKGSNYVLSGWSPILSLLSPRRRRRNPRSPPLAEALNVVLRSLSASGSLFNQVRTIFCDKVLIFIGFFSGGKYYWVKYWVLVFWFDFCFWVSLLYMRMTDLGQVSCFMGQRQISLFDLCSSLVFWFCLGFCFCWFFLEPKIDGTLDLYVFFCLQVFLAHWWRKFPFYPQPMFVAYWAFVIWSGLCLFVAEVTYGSLICCSRNDSIKSRSEMIALFLLFFFYSWVYIYDLWWTWT